jgi:hypothetical protein
VCRTPSALVAAGLEVDEAILRASLVCLLHDPAASHHRLQSIMEGAFDVPSWLSPPHPPPTPHPHPSPHIQNHTPTSFPRPACVT